MDKMEKINLTIKEIYLLIKKQKNSNFIISEENIHEVYHFKYTGNIKKQEDIHKLDTNPSILIYGDDRQKFISYFRDLYDLFEYTKKGISFDFFYKKTKQLIFRFRLNYKEIENIFISLKKEEFFKMSIIYGFKGSNILYTLHNFTFVSLDNLKDYLDTNKVHNEMKKLIPDFHPNDVFCNSFKNNNCMFVMKKYLCCDCNYIEENFLYDTQLLTNILRFMTRNINDRYYVSEYEEHNSSKRHITFSKTSSVSNSSGKLKDGLHIFNYENFLSNKFNHNRIWEILSKNIKCDFENKLLLSLNWAGLAMRLDNLSISFVNLITAFDSLLSVNTSNTPISTGIQATISDLTAFICGDDYCDRIQIKQNMKKYYGMRSAIVHNGKNDISLDEFISLLSIYYQLIDRLLENYSSIKNIKEILDILEKNKFTKN